MANELYLMLDLIRKLFQILPFGLIWIIIGLILLIVTILIPKLNNSKSLIIVKSVGFTLGAVFLLPGMTSVCLCLMKVGV